MEQKKTLRPLGSIDSAVDPDQEYVNFLAATPPSACDIHSAKHIIPFFAHFQWAQGIKMEKLLKVHDYEIPADKNNVNI